MDKSTVVRHIPANDAQTVREHLGGGRLRARGARVHNGRRYFQDLPPKLAQRFSLYNNYGFSRGRQYMDYVCFDGEKIRLRYNQAETI